MVPRPYASSMRALARTLLVFLLTVPLLGQKDPVSRSWNRPVNPFRIAGNLYYVGASDVTAFLITTPDGHIVLDGGLEETAPMILANIRKLGFKVSDVKILLNSHAHMDHAGGLARLKRSTGAKLYATAQDAPLLARGGRDDPQFGNMLTFPPVVADQTVSDGQAVVLGGTSLVARHTPGHTPGCTTWTMRVGDLDVVFVGSATVPGIYRLVNNPRYPNIISDYRRQFVTLRSLECDIFLASHGSFFDLAKKRAALTRKPKVNPFIDSEGYHRFVADQERRFERHVRNETPAATR